MNIALVFLGGGLGAAARYILQGVVYRFVSPAFPYGTLAVNVIGAFLIGLVITMFEERFLVSPGFRVFLTIGVLGGFTTFSSFSYETFALLRGGSFMPALANVAANVGVCLGATWLGAVLGRLL